MTVPENGDLSATIVDRNRLYRAGLRLTLESANVDVVAEFDDLESVASGSTRSFECEVLLMKMPPAATATAVIENARRSFPSAKVVVVADGELNPGKMVKAIEGGADGILLADLSPDVFLQSLRLVRLGEKVLPARLASVLIGGEAHGSTMLQDVRAYGLSEREAEILRLLVDGRSNKEIALRLDITEATVKVHVKAVLRKIRVTNRTQAAVWAMNHGLGCEESVA